MIYLSDKIISRITDKIKKIIVNKYPNFDWSNFNFNLEIPPSSEMGDFAFSCFVLAKSLKKDPKILADELVKNIKREKYLEKVVNIGPYVNFFLKKEEFIKAVFGDILKCKEKYGQAEKNKQKIMVEYSSPNTNKPLHLGHLRNNVLGMSLANLLEENGHQVIKANLINDRGIHICKAILAYQKIKQGFWKEGEYILSKKVKSDHLIGDLYILFEKKLEEEKEKYLKDKNFDLKILTDREKDKLEFEFLKQSEIYQEAQTMLKKWEQGDKEIRGLWQKINQLALSGIKQTYQRMGTIFNKWYFESQTYQLGKKIVLKALKNKVCYKRDDGAIEIDLTKYGLDKKVLIRDDGTSVYITQDIGLAKKKFDDYRLAQSIYIVASEQDYHFKVLFKVLKLFDFKWAKDCEHLSYGMVYLPEGKMKSRKGIVVEADDLLDKMFNLAREEILKRDPKIKKTELEKRAEKIGQGALKFYLLKVSPKQDILFNPKESISFEGDTGPYIQYAYARIRSILRKSHPTGGHPKGEKIGNINFGLLNKAEEWEIVKLFYEFSSMIKKSAEEYNPSLLANYLLKLAGSFNEFYQQCPVISAENEELKIARICLIKAVGVVLKKGLELLGIKTCEKM